MTTTTQPAELPALSDEQIDKLLNDLDDLALSFGDDLPGLALNSRGLERSRAVVRAALAATGAQARADQAAASAHAIRTAAEMEAEPRTLEEAMAKLRDARAEADAYLDALQLLQERTPLAAQAAPAVPEGQAERFSDMRHYLNEAHQFAAMSPRGRDCIGIALDILDEAEAAALAAAPTPAAQAPAQASAPARKAIEWQTGPNLFKDWCAQWFGPDADDAYLARAVAAFPAGQPTVGELPTQVAIDKAKAALGYSQAFDGKGIDWQNGEPWPHRIELAQALDWITDLGAVILNLADRVVPPLVIEAPAVVDGQQPLTDEQKQAIHNATGAGHALICLVESYIRGTAASKPPVQDAAPQPTKEQQG